MIIYIIKTTICFILFIAFYKLLLEKENMHVFKRFYLIASLIIAFIIPSIVFTEYVYIDPQPSIQSYVPDFALNEFQATPISEKTDYLNIILWSIYGLGVMVFGFKFLQNLFKIGNRITKNPKIKKQHITNVLLQEKLAPHTFFNFIFLNKQKYEAHEIPTEVLLHEQTHADQKHSIDVLFIELLQVLLWFNPLVYVYRRAIKLNHEFLADYAVVQNGTATTRYQKILLAFSSNAAYQETALTNAINYSSIKKRFTVMKTNTSKKAIWLRSLLVLPLVALALYSFSETKVLAVQKPIEIQKSVDYLPDEKLIISEVIELYINPQEQIFLKDKQIKIENLKEHLLEFNSDLSKSERQEIVAVEIKVDQKLDAFFLNKLELILKDYGYATINIIGPVFEQNGASKTQLAEYNVLAKKYNEQPINSRIIKKIELEKLESIYRIMTSEQKQNSQPFPECPPQPGVNQDGATKAQISEYNALSKKYNSIDFMRIKKAEMDRLEYLYSIMNDAQKSSAEPYPDFPPMPEPPMPPSAPNVLNYARELAKKDAQFYFQDEKISTSKGLEIIANEPNIKVKTHPWTNKQPEVKIYLNDKSSIVQIGESSNIPIPPMPATPKTPLDHVIEMAKKGATFYYENEKISSDKAIELLKNNEYLNIDTRGSNTKKPVVRISKNAIVIED